MFSIFGREKFFRPGQRWYGDFFTGKELDKLVAFLPRTVPFETSEKHFFRF